MPEMPPTSPHFIGLLVAIAGACLLTFWLTRERVRQQLGDRRRTVAWVAGLVLLAVGLLGNGVHGTAAKGSLWTGGLLHSKLPFSQAHVDRAMETALSDEFIAYHHQLYGSASQVTSADLKARLELAWRPYTSSQKSSGAYPANGQVLSFTYYDTQNGLLGVLGIGSEPMSQRHRYWDTVTHDYLDELIALEYLTSAATDDIRIAALQMMLQGVVTAAEWVDRALRKMEKTTLSAPVRAQLKKTSAIVRGFLDDPTRRRLPKDFRLTLE